MNAAGKRSRLSAGLWIVFNTLVAVGVVNLLVAGYLQVVEAPAAVNPSALVEPGDGARIRGDQALEHYGMELFRKVYPDKSDDDIKALVRGQAVLDTYYEPFAEFRQPAGSSWGATVHEAGFRLIGPEQGPWPLDPNALNVFVFGGSTTVGAGVRDEETVPANLQALLRAASGRDAINVYNFGVSASYSSQEVAYFQNQLRYGNIPDVVVFIDGLNDFVFWDGLTAASAQYRDSLAVIQTLNALLGRDRGFFWHVGELVRAMPMARLARRLGATPPAQPAVGAPVQPVDPPELAEPGRLATVIDRYLVNRDVAASVARGFGIEPVFVWQPIPTYKYDISFHAFDVPEVHRISKYGYPLMARLVSDRPLGPDFVWCADIQESLREPLYVDSVHYTSAMSHRVAECVAGGVARSGALERAWRAKFEADRPLRVSARALISPRQEHRVAELFDTSAQTPELRVEESPAGERRLVDASPSYGAVLQDIPLAPGQRTSNYRVSLLLRAGTSPYSQLVLQFLGEDREPNHVYFNARTMQIIRGRGAPTLEPAGEGWYRLSLSARSSGAETLRVLLYPRHGVPEDTGDLGFGGGELWVEDDVSGVDVAAPASPTP